MEGVTIDMPWAAKCLYDVEHSSRDVRALASRCCLEPYLKIENLSVAVLGPTGSGKTAICKSLQRTVGKMDMMRKFAKMVTSDKESLENKEPVERIPILNQKWKEIKLEVVKAEFMSDFPVSFLSFYDQYGRDKAVRQVTLLDCPGRRDCLIDAIKGVGMAQAAIVVIDGMSFAQGFISDSYMNNLRDIITDQVSAAVHLGINQFALAFNGISVANAMGPRGLRGVWQQGIRDEASLFNMLRREGSKFLAECIGPNKDPKEIPVVLVNASSDEQIDFGTANDLARTEYVKGSRLLTAFTLAMVIYQFKGHSDHRIGSVSPLLMSVEDVKQEGEETAVLCQLRRGVIDSLSLQQSSHEFTWGAQLDKFSRLPRIQIPFDNETVVRPRGLFKILYQEKNPPSNLKRGLFGYTRSNELAVAAWPRSDFVAQIVVIDRYISIKAGTEMTMVYNAAEVTVEVEKIICTVDAETDEVLSKEPAEIAAGTHAQLQFSVTEGGPISCLPIGHSKLDKDELGYIPAGMSKFVLLEENETVALGYMRVPSPPPLPPRRKGTLPRM